MKLPLLPSDFSVALCCKLNLICLVFGSQGKAGGAYEDRKLIEYSKRDVIANEDGTTTVIPRADYVTGTVDMKAYLFWLRSHGYDIGNLQVQ